ncbi:MAG: radical SAM protein [Deltaproteobacteria bacterium]|nr:radical SAM protein [Deltaproteobacteria bacterium]
MTINPTPSDKKKIESREITFYLPGMIKDGQERGKYPAISITGPDCRLNCQHCQGRLLIPMIPAETPERLIITCRQLAAQGNIGVLLSGGSDSRGVVPWARFCDAIAAIKEETGLIVSVHTGIMTAQTARRLKQAGVDQALTDVVGDERTAREVLRLDGGLSDIKRTLDALTEAGLDMVPHIVAGLYFGQIKGEYQAWQIIAAHRPAAAVLVVLTPFKGTPMSDVTPPDLEELAELLGAGRSLLPDTPISLGCERPRGKKGRLLEALALEAGIDRIAVPDEATVDLARSSGWRVRLQKTCCSIPFLDLVGRQGKVLPR